MTTKIPTFETVTDHPHGIPQPTVIVRVARAPGEPAPWREAQAAAHELAAHVLRSTPSGEQWALRVSHGADERTCSGALVILELMHGDATEVGRAKLVIKSAITDYEIKLGVLRERADGSYTRVGTAGDLDAVINEAEVAVHGRAAAAEHARVKAIARAQFAGMVETPKRKRTKAAK